MRLVADPTQNHHFYFSSCKLQYTNILYRCLGRAKGETNMKTPIDSYNELVPTMNKLLKEDKELDSKETSNYKEVYSIIKKMLGND